MQSITQNLTQKRNYGIDLLRIISMIMIPVLHILGHGGILENTTTLSIHNEIAWLLEIASLCAINSYALISGYVGYGRKQKYSNIIYLYFQVIFYTLLTTAVFIFYKPELVSLTTIVNAIFPFAYSTYWYFSAYFCLFFFTPFLNLALDKFEKATIQKLLLLLFMIFSVLPTLFYSDFGCTNAGYSFLWLAILYLTGGYIKKYGLSFSRTNRTNLIGYFICVILTWLSKICIELITNILFHEPIGGGYLISYTSPTIILCSVFLLLFFANIKCGKKLTRFIQFFSPLVFGVYLFHDEPLIRETFLKNAFIGYLSFNPIVMILAVIGTAIAIWFVGSLADKIRLTVFNLLKIKELSIFLEHKISEFVLFLKKKIKSATRTK